MFQEGERGSQKSSKLITEPHPLNSNKESLVTGKSSCSGLVRELSWKSKHKFKDQPPEGKLFQ